ncbi:MAG: radical SAM protein [Lachnospiraceae bacterium]|nr:radical SAM protein [Lachnospiraceae bacterium]
MSLMNSASPVCADTVPYRKAFSVVYVEEAAWSHPRTQRILAKLPGATVIRCRDYREIFNRPHQEPALQKMAQALILAVSDRARVYAGAPVCQDFGNDRFYYTSDVMNCVFDCEYCYLQGMYPSGHVVVFVNLEDTFAELDRLLAADTPYGESTPPGSPAYVCISYDTDLLALEPLLGYVGQWIAYAADRPSLTLELRTKAASASILRSLPASDRIILALTLSPDPVIRAMEHRTPSLSARLALAAEAISLGWKVRLCFDPMIALHDAAAVYDAMFDEVFAALPMAQVHDASVGLFRISREYLKDMRHRRPCAVTCYPYQLTDGVYHYPPEIGDPLIRLAVSRLSQQMPRERIFLWDAVPESTD